jgi:hypothetical protein
MFAQDVTTSGEHFRRVAMALLLAALAGCGGGGGGGGSDSGEHADTPLASSKLAFNQAGPLSLTVGETLANPASGLGSGAISYSSNHTDIAAIDSAGNITALAPGSASISANQPADSVFAAGSASLVVNVVASPSLDFTLTAWVGKTDTVAEFSSGADGVAFYRSTDSNCDLANYSTCANGQLDILNGSAVTDTAANSERSAFYRFVSGGARADLLLGVQELPLSRGFQVEELNGQLYAVGGYRNGAAVGDDVWVSSDGTHWAQLTEAAGFAQHSDFGMAVFNNRLWIAGGKGLDAYGSPNNYLHDVWSSSNGIDWTQATAAAAFAARQNPNLIAYQGKLWLIGGYDNTTTAIQDAWSSTDGISWTQEVENLPFEARHLVVFNNVLYAASAQGIWTSSDGVSWSQITAATGYNRADGLAVHDNKLWVVSYQSNSLSETWYSADGISWSKLPVTQSYSQRYDTELTSFNKRLFMFGGVSLLGTPTSDQWVLESSVWMRNIPGPAYRDRERHAAIHFKGSLWVIGGKSYGDYLHDVWRSDDGIHWTQATASAAFSGRFDHKVIAYNSKLWLYGGVNASGQLADVWSSSDGVNWVAETADAIFATRTDYGLVEFNGQLWIFGGEATADGSYLNQVWHSGDGINWAQDTGSNFPSRSKMALAVHNGQLWMLGGESAFNTYKDDAWYSSDGSTWVQATASGGFGGRAWPQLYERAGRLLVTGGAKLADPSNYVASFADIWSSGDGLSWTRDNADAAFGSLYLNPVIAKDGALWMLGGSVYKTDFRKMLWRSTDGVHWRTPKEFELSQPN